MHTFSTKSAMRTRLSIPASRLTVSAATEKRAAFVRDAVAIVQVAFRDENTITLRSKELLASRWSLGTLLSEAPPTLMSAWALVSIRLIGRLLGTLSQSESIRDAESWFLGNRAELPLVAGLVDFADDRRAVQRLEHIPYDENLGDLLPYVLDPYGPGSRASVLRNPRTSLTRAAKRASGAFYTPADVAEYIASASIDLHGSNPKELRFLDPACGTGVFLKAVLDHLCGSDGEQNSFEVAERCLFGFDIDPIAVNAACFVLLHECLLGTKDPSLTPWSMWHRLRLNIVAADALAIVPASERSLPVRERTSLRTQIAREYVPPAVPPSPSHTTAGLFQPGYRLDEVLPELPRGADIVLGNPPYAPVGRRIDVLSLQQHFTSFSGTRASKALDLFPLFVEMMWRFAKPSHSAAGMVVPLSLAYHRGMQMRACRRAISSSGGQWRFAFFDREPHALFGEDVKTRNTIAFRCESDVFPKRGEQAVVETGPLRRWTSRTRSRLFNGIDFTRLEEYRICDGIPKLSGAEESRAFAVLARRIMRLSTSWMHSRSRMPVEACEQVTVPCVFVASTAYNFLNVFRPHRTVPPPQAAWSENRLHALEFVHEDRASRVFAILSSRLIYWLWHVLEDGFHVSRRFLAGIPVNDSSFDRQQQGLLSALGAELWDALQGSQIVSVNGGRQSVAYRPYACETLRDRIDAVLLEAVGIDARFLRRLRSLVRGLVTVDEGDDRRRHFLEQFQRIGKST